MPPKCEWREEAVCWILWRSDWSWARRELDAEEAGVMWRVEVVMMVLRAHFLDLGLLFGVGTATVEGAVCLAERATSVGSFKIQSGTMCGKTSKFSLTQSI